MANTVALIGQTVTSEALWATVGNVIPVTLIVTMFALGFYLVRRQLKKVSKARWYVILKGAICSLYSL